MAVPFGYQIAPKVGRPPVAVVCHLFHADFSEWLLDILARMELAADVFVSTDTPEKAALIRQVLARWAGGSATIRVADNRGRDIAPKIVTFADVYDRYGIVLFLHSKKSSHYDFGEEWRDYLVKSLAGSSFTVQSIMDIFDRCPEVGMVVPQHYPPLLATTAIDWASNYRPSQRLAWRMDIDLSPSGYVDMPSGSMFWARSRALRPLLSLELGLDDFPPELGQLDMTTAHCIERLFLFVCERAGFTWVKVADGALAQTDRTVTPIGQPDQIGAFLERHRFDLLDAAGQRR